CPPMTELQFESLTTKGLPQKLVSETNAKNWNPGFDKISHSPNGITQRRWVPRSVRKKNSFGFVGHRLGRRRLRRHHLHSKTALAQPPKDVVLHPEIIGDDRYIGRRQGCPNIAGVPTMRPAH